MRLLCLPHAGGSAMAYARWRRGLPASVEVVPVELPGRGARMDEPFARDPVRLAEALAAALRDEAVRVPYALFGHSLGALIAFELAHALIARGAPAPRMLFASGTEAPSVRDDSDWRRPRSDAELVAELRAMRGTPEEAFESAELMQAVLPVLRADFLLCGAYAHRPRPPLPCPIQALGGRDDDVPHASLAAWARETAAGFDLALFGGGHFFLHERPEAVLELIARRLSGAALRGAGLATVPA